MKTQSNTKKVIFYNIIQQNNTTKRLTKSTVFKGKYLCRGLFFNKVLLKKTLRHRCFPVNFAKNFQNTFFIGQLQRLLLYIIPF